MEIDLTKLVTNNLEDIDVDVDVSYDDDKLSGTSIRELRNVRFVGEVTKLCNDDFRISGKLSGIMVLPDDITLEDFLYEFSIDILEDFSEYGDNESSNLKIIKNKLDISDFLWQNILVEIPSKVVNEKNRNLTLKGNGWRFVTEDELQKEKKSPFDELASKFE